MNKFMLNGILAQYIEVSFPSSVQESFFMTIVEQKFYTSDNSYLLGKDDILTILRDKWIIGLKETLNNKRFLKIGTRGLGYEWNQVSAQEIPYRADGKYWWGIDYLLAEGGDDRRNTSSWLYNDEQGQIIFEITENYFWHFADESEGKNYITYQEFMKNYKPLVTRVISHEVARRWLAQFEHLLEQICENERKWDEHIALNEQLHKEGKCEECNAKGITYG